MFLTLSSLQNIMMMCFVLLSIISSVWVRSVVSGQTPLKEDQAGLPAGRGGVLRRRHLEHLVRPRPDHRRPRHGQGTTVWPSLEIKRSSGLACFICESFPPPPCCRAEWGQTGPPACPRSPAPAQDTAPRHPPAEGRQRLFWPQQGEPPVSTHSTVFNLRGKNLYYSIIQRSSCQDGDKDVDVMCVSVFPFWPLQCRRSWRRAAPPPETLPMPPPR